MRNDRNDQFEYDVQKRARAGTTATFRVLVSFYLVYLGWSVLRGIRSGTSPVPVWVGWLVMLVFTGVAVFFCFYTWRRYQQDKEAARLHQSGSGDEEEVLPAEESAEQLEGADEANAIPEDTES